LFQSLPVNLLITAGRDFTGAVTDVAFTPFVGLMCAGTLPSKRLNCRPPLPALPLLLAALLPPKPLFPCGLLPFPKGLLAAGLFGIPKLPLPRPPEAPLN